MAIVGPVGLRALSIGKAYSQTPPLSATAKLGPFPLAFPRACRSCHRAYLPSVDPIQEVAQKRIAVVVGD